MNYLYILGVGSKILDVLICQTGRRQGKEQLIRGKELCFPALVFPPYELKTKVLGLAFLILVSYQLSYESL
jgi:hypothetical protein